MGSGMGSGVTRSDGGIDRRPLWVPPACGCTWLHLVAVCDATLCGQVSIQSCILLV
jgi:hypothetical protein